ncbi:hypothetical protein KIH74_27315 [Kineosporia sp. J2-2]|uniref:Lipoprotein n=1 Tax=Kineosporia corallincola TaxID=2835133 RepID=A0ABS5TNK6_9ACTN|nr:hypothetical protein [Kineosporia corallincola]MBT0772684.1 hypothetical protein [Kineosporia corallincola]
MRDSAFRRSALILAVAAAGSLAVLTACASPGERSPLVAAPVAPTWQNAGITPGPDPDDPHADTWKYAGDIAELAGDATLQAQSVHVEGTTEEEGEPATFDLSLDRDGHGTGSIRMDAVGSGELMFEDDDYYLKPDPRMLSLYAGTDAGTTQYLKGKWLHFPNDESSGLTGLTMENLVDSLNLPDGDAAWRLIDGDATFGGHKAIELQVLDEDWKIFVAADGPAELVGFEGPDGSYVYSDWDEPVTVKAPSESVPMVYPSAQA